MEQKNLYDVIATVLKEQEKSVKAYFSGNDKVKGNLFVYLFKQVSKKFNHNIDLDLVKKSLEEALKQIQPTPESQPSQQQTQPPADLVTKAFRYRCKCDCTFGGDYHRQGDIIVSDKKLEVPHFEPVENKKE